MLGVKLHPLPKAATGIEGFDAVSRGGVPRKRTTLLKGGPGAGKTVFALQCLVNAARKRQERGLFVAFEESTRQILANAATFDWGLPALMKGKLFFLDARLSPDIVSSSEREKELRRIRSADSARRSGANGSGNGERKASKKEARHAR